MKNRRLSRNDFYNVRFNRKSAMSCHKKKNGPPDDIYLEYSRNKKGDILCVCCKKIFFTNDEYARLCELTWDSNKLSTNDKSLIDTYKNIELTCAKNCCKSCNFSWYCSDCCFTFQETVNHDKINTCGMSILNAVYGDYRINPLYVEERYSFDSKTKHYSFFTDESINCLKKHFKKDMKYKTKTTHPLKGKSVIMSELLEKFRKNK
jgi:hypothetical protein